ncbi:MAG TPA: 5'-methylthioadenosine/S-adenosylhomocysteine nucleosidase [Anaerolineales bacterium]
MNIVVIVSANSEWEAVKSVLPDVKPVRTLFGERFDAKLDRWPVTFFQGGWGKVSAAASAQYVMDQLHPELVVNLGTCGGFEGRIEEGIVILVEKTIIYDIIELMTDPEEAIQRYTTEIDLSWLPRLTPSPVLRGHLVSADRDILPQDIPALIQKYDAVAADWESGAIAWVAKRNHQRLLILRAVSDLVGAQGDDVYGEYEEFSARAREIMRRLIDLLPKWLDGIEKVEQGYHV